MSRGVLRFGELEFAVQAIDGTLGRWAHRRRFDVPAPRRGADCAQPHQVGRRQRRRVAPRRGAQRPAYARCDGRGHRHECGCAYRLPRRQRHLHARRRAAGAARSCGLRCRHPRGRSGPADRRGPGAGQDGFRARRRRARHCARRRHGHHQCRSGAIEQHLGARPTCRSRRQRKRQPCRSRHRCAPDHVGSAQALPPRRTPGRKSSLRSRDRSRRPSARSTSPRSRAGLRCAPSSNSRRSSTCWRAENRRLHRPSKACRPRARRSRVDPPPRRPPRALPAPTRTLSGHVHWCGTRRRHRARRSRSRRRPSRLSHCRRRSTFARHRRRAHRGRPPPRRSRPSRRPRRRATPPRVHAPCRKYCLGASFRESAVGNQVASLESDRGGGTRDQRLVVPVAPLLAVGHLVAVEIEHEQANGR